MSRTFSVVTVVAVIAGFLASAGAGYWYANYYRANPGSAAGAPAPGGAGQAAPTQAKAGGGGGA
ncbi:MAG: hypothetical protein ABI777_14480, partial [Betaproteobacteria bacterium]